MAETTANSVGSLAPAPTLIHEKLKKGPGTLGKLGFGIVLLGGLIFIGVRLLSDLKGDRKSVV